MERLTLYVIIFGMVALNYQYIQKNGVNNFGKLLKNLQRVQNNKKLKITNKNLIGNCESNPCYNKGICRDIIDNNEFYCDCQMGFTGNQCEISKCACQNGGKCINTGQDIICQCPPGWYGIHCTDRYDYCEPNEHFCDHGECLKKRVKIGQPVYKCICDPGWTNNFNSFTCDTDINECRVNLPCSQKPFVECINLPGSFECGVCPEGYLGDGIGMNGCYKNPCHKNSCLHGDCEPIDSIHYQCVCNPGYSGINCDLNIDECASNPCFGGDVCIDAVNTYICACSTDHPRNLCEAFDPCKGLLTTDENVMISTQYSIFQNLSIKCFLTVSVPENKWIQLTVLKLGLDQSAMCNDNYVEIFNVKNEFIYPPQHFCSVNSPKNLLSIFNKLLIIYYFHLNHKKHFQAISKLAYEGYFYDLNGTFQSPHFPNQYPNNQDNTYIIKQPVGMHICLKFTTFDIEYCYDCSCDYLEIYNGFREKDALLGKYCGNEISNAIILKSNNLLVKFKSDQVDQRYGFNANYIAFECEVLSMELNGTWHLPILNSYCGIVDCFYVIKNSSGMAIALNITSNNPQYIPKCSQMSLKIYDGLNEDAPLINQYCNENYTITYSKTNSLFIKLSYDSSIELPQFIIYYNSFQCGYELNELEGVLKSPSFFNIPNSQDLECMYLITNPRPTAYIILSIDVFNFSCDCSLNYLEIRDGKDANAHLIGHYCATNHPGKIVSKGNNLWLKFKYLCILQESVFHIRYSVHICGGEFNELSGMLKSPEFLLFPQLSGHSQDCLYVIRSSSISVIYLIFTFFDIEFYPKCIYDYLEIRNGTGKNAQQIGKYCGRVLPERIMVTTTALSLHLKTDDSIHGKGFQAFYFICGQIFTEEKGFFHSPFFPKYNYTSNIECIYIIKNKDGYLINIVFDHFDLEFESKCDYDYVEIRNGDCPTSPLLARYCGSTIPPLISVISSSLWIKFRSNGIINRKGFYASYNISDCIYKFSEETGILQLPYYEDNIHSRDEYIIHSRDENNIYSSNEDNIHSRDEDNMHYSYGNNMYSSDGDNMYMECHYMIKLKNNRTKKGSQEAWKLIKIQLNFENVHYFRNFDCINDFIEIRKGYKPNDSLLIGKYCHNLKEVSLLLEDDMFIKIRFKKRNLVLNHVGHQDLVTIANYEIIHTPWNNVFNNVSGVLKVSSNDGCYQGSNGCNYLINQKLNNTLVLLFNIFNINNHYERSCSNAFLEIHRISNGNTQLLGKYCNSNLQSSNIITATTSLWLRIKFSDASNKVEIEYYNYNENDSYYYKSKGKLFSPGFPYQYPPDIEKIFIIKLKPGSLIYLNYIYFDIEESQNCSKDFLQINDGVEDSSPLIDRFCGQVIPTLTTFRSNVLRLKFKSNHKIQNKGFLVHYSSCHCNKTYTLDNGAISSPSCEPFANLNCDIRIILPANSYISLFFNYFYFGDDFPFQQGCLEVRGGDSPSGFLIGRYCGSKFPLPIYTGNQIWMRINISSSADNRKFDITYTSSSHVCGGNLTGWYGTFTNPKNSTNTSCEWTIWVPFGHRVNLKFKKFIFKEEAYCLNNYIEVRDGATNDSSLINRNCGTNSPTIIASKNVLYVKFVSDEKGSINDFRAVYFY